MRTETPSPDMAAVAAERVMGWRPVAVSRFPTGADHFVFEARAPDGTAVVVRMGQRGHRESMVKGTRLARRLRTLGVPLPDILDEGLNQEFPYVVMERLPGTDLGHVIGSLSDTELRDIAQNVADAQAATARLGAGSRYGYAASPEEAPLPEWADVLLENIDRSRQRLTSAGLFDVTPLDLVTDELEACRADLRALPATPFLHDTTTRNVMVAPDGGFSGIVDVDDLCFGDPRYAPALTLAVLLGQGGPAQYVEHWMGLAGHRDDRVFGLYVALFLLDLMGEHGQVFNSNQSPSSPAAREQLLRAFSEVTATFGS